MNRRNFTRPAVSVRKFEEGERTPFAEDLDPVDSVASLDRRRDANKTSVVAFLFSAL